jgi:hypothetical protein
MRNCTRITDQNVLTIKGVEYLRITVILNITIGKPHEYFDHTGNNRGQTTFSHLLVDLKTVKTVVRLLIMLSTF